LRVAVEREARRMAGYRLGRDIAERFLTLLAQDSQDAVGSRIARFLEGENDPRLTEIMRRLETLCFSPPPQVAR
jgi:formate hydrogenlyase subunit 7